MKSKLLFMAFFILIFSPSGYCLECPKGDLSGNCRVDIEDLAIVASLWLDVPEECQETGINAHWKLDEVNDGTTPDVNKDYFKATLYGDPTFDPDKGKLGGAIFFDGIGDYLLNTINRGIGGMAPRTVSFWINTYTSSGPLVWWGDWQEEGNLWYIDFFTPDGQQDAVLRVDVYGGFCYGSTAVNTGQWVHLAVVMPSGLNNTDSIVLYVNGKPEPVNEMTVLPLTIKTGYQNGVTMGVMDIDFYKGWMDDVRLYSRDLSSEEIKSLYESGSSQRDCPDLDGDQRVAFTDLAMIAENWQKKVGPVIINEFLASNKSSEPLENGEILDGDGKSSDWIELYNPTHSDIDMTGWYLTDKADNLQKWPFPQGYIIQGGKHKILFASEKDQEDYPSNYPYEDPLHYYHTNFKLTPDGEYLALIDPEGTIVHEYNSVENDKEEMGYPKQLEDVSYGMYEDDEMYFGSPTPGTFNQSAFLGFIEDTNFSHDRGFYDDPFEVTITTKTDDTQIYYTTDGSVPSLANGTLYNGPVTIDRTTCLRAKAFKPGFRPTNTDTQTYIFVDRVISNADMNGGIPANGPWPTSGVNGQSLRYGMNTSIVNDSRYSDIMDDALLAIPTMSMVTDLDNLFDSSTGIYVNASQDGENWERPVSLELIHPDGDEGFQIDCGLRIRGGFSRSNNNPKHAFRLFFKKQYGESKLRYPLFGNEGADEFDKVDLRTSQNYSWAFQGNNNNTMIREVFSRDSQRDMGQPYTRSRYYHLYINGHYWGLFMTQERAEARHAATYFGGDAEDYDTIKHLNHNRINYATDGFTDDFYELFDESMAGFSSNTRYYKVQGLNTNGTVNSSYPKMVDLDNLIVYMLGIFYSCDSDSPISNFMGNSGLNNMYCTYNRVNPNGWVFYRHDGEHTLDMRRIDDRTGPWNHSNFNLPQYFNPQTLHQKLTANPNYVRYFGDQTHKFFYNDGAMTTEKVHERLWKRINEIEMAIVAESARWGNTSLNRDSSWWPAVNRVLGYCNGRFENTLLGQLRNDGWYPSIDAPVFVQHGGRVEKDFELGIANPNGSGEIYYTLNGKDPITDGILLTSTGGGGDPQPEPMERTLVPENADKKVKAVTSDIGISWRTDNDYNDDLWNDGIPADNSKTGGVGYERNSGYEPYISYDINSEMTNATCAYIRIRFNVDQEDLDLFNYMKLRYRVDDAAVFYLNGHTDPIYSYNFSGVPQWNSTQSGPEAGSVITQDVSGHVSKLRAGENILTIHGINQGTGSSDFLISAELVAGFDPEPVIDPDYFLALEKSSVLKTRAKINDKWSALNEAVFSVGPIHENLRITEIFYNPDGDPNEEYIELTNIGDEIINLNLVKFTKGIDYSFPSTGMAPGQKFLIVSNVQKFQARFGTEPYVFATFKGSLDNSGEHIKLVDATGQIIHSVKYKDDWYDITDGEGFSLVNTVPASTDPNSWMGSDKIFWRPSALKGGSPGSDDLSYLPAAPGSIVINELLSHSHSFDPDWIELKNVSGNTIDISGWYLSDSGGNDPNRMKFKIPNNTILGPGDYVVFNEDDHFGINSTHPGRIIPFGLSEGGETLYLQSADLAGNLTGYYETESFGPGQSNVAFGRFTKSTGTVNFVAMSQNTENPPYTNKYPKVGPIVITEVHYNPGPGANIHYEFIELMNNSNSTVELQDQAGTQQSDNPLDYITETIPWKFTKGIDFTFPPGVSLQAKEKILIVKDIQAFTSRYNSQIPGGTQIFEWESGKLDNGGESIELSMPGDQEWEKKRFYIRRERVTYGDSDPWPADADGTGKSLQHIRPEDTGNNYSNDPVNWTSDLPTPGY